MDSLNLSFTSLVSISDYVFSDCISLKYISFPVSLTSIGDGAFRNCSLDSVVLSYCTSLTSIGNAAFAHGVLDVIKFPAKLTSVGDEAFSGCRVRSLDFSSTSLTSIGSRAFAYCYDLESIRFPVSLASMGDDAFISCSSLSKLTVDEDNPIYASHDNVLYTNGLFTLLYYPIGLGTAVIIPDGVHSIREDAFPCEVSAVYCQPQTPPEAVDGEFQEMFSADELMNAVLYVPIGTKAAYMKVDPWRNFWNIEEADIAAVGIDGVTAQGEPTVTVRGGKIVVDGASTTGVIEVFSTNGRCAYRGTSTVIEGLPKGAYVVRIGKFTQKVML